MQRLDRVKHERDARLHVEHAGPVQATVCDVTRHGRKRSQRIDGIEMAEQQNRLDLFSSVEIAAEIDLYIIGELVGAVHMRASAQGLETHRE